MSVAMKQLPHSADIAPFEDFDFDLEGIGALIYRTVNERLEQHLADGRDVKATWTRLDQILDEIQDPEVGLALLAERPEGATPEQAHDLLFWQIQFTQWRDWRAGDVQADARALAAPRGPAQPQKEEWRRR